MTALPHVGAAVPAVVTLGPDVFGAGGCGLNLDHRGRWFGDNRGFIADIGVAAGKRSESEGKNSGVEGA